MTSTFLPLGVRTLRSVPTCPSRAGLLKPVTSVAGNDAVSSPMSSAARPQPDPRVTAMSWCATPVRRAMSAAAVVATSNGSTAGSSRGWRSRGTSSHSRKRGAPGPDAPADTPACRPHGGATARPPPSCRRGVGASVRSRCSLSRASPPPRCASSRAALTEWMPWCRASSASSPSRSSAAAPAGTRRRSRRRSSAPTSPSWSARASVAPPSSPTWCPRRPSSPRPTPPSRSATPAASACSCSPRTTAASR